MLGASVVGIFCNLEHVSSPTPELSSAFWRALGADREVEEDPSNRCIPVGVPVGCLAERGFELADCHWKRREMALLAGMKPGAAAEPPEPSRTHDGSSGQRACALPRHE